MLLEVKSSIKTVGALQRPSMAVLKIV